MDTQNNRARPIEALIDDYSKLGDASEQSQARKAMHDEIIDLMAYDFKKAQNAKPAFVETSYEFTNGVKATLTTFDGDSRADTLTLTKDGQMSALRTGAEAVKDLQLVLHSPGLETEEQVTKEHFADGTTLSDYKKPRAKSASQVDELIKLDFGDGVTEEHAVIKGRQFNTATVNRPDKFEQFQPVPPEDMSPPLYKEISTRQTS